MQTFLPLPTPKESAQVLDRHRLGKQRVEAVQIARTLLKLNDGWRNHPAVKMWKGYEAYLIKIYLRDIMDEWISRGYRNEKCEQHFIQLSELVGDSIKPYWIDNDFCISHQSNLVRKKPEYYRQFFPNVPDDLEYVWPI
jgi:hypothetical protein